MLFKREYTWPTVFYPVCLYPNLSELQNIIHRSLVDNAPLPYGCILIRIKAQSISSASSKKERLLKCLGSVTGQVWSCV